MVETPETAANESKEAKQGENIKVPEPEHNRPGAVRTPRRGRKVAGQEREVLAALRNDVDTGGGVRARPGREALTSQAPRTQN